jgi:hypothetical protein
MYKPYTAIHIHATLAGALNQTAPDILNVRGGLQKLFA